MLPMNMKDRLSWSRISPRGRATSSSGAATSSHSGSGLSCFWIVTSRRATIRLFALGASRVGGVEVGIPKRYRKQRLNIAGRSRRGKVDAPVAPAIGLLVTRIRKTAVDRHRAVFGCFHRANELQKIVVEIEQHTFAHLALEHLDESNSGECKGDGNGNGGGNQQPEA